MKLLISSLVILYTKDSLLLENVIFIIVIVYNKIVDGKHPSIAFATTGGKVLIHSPYANQSAAAAN